MKLGLSKFVTVLLVVCVNQHLCAGQEKSESRIVIKVDRAKQKPVVTSGGIDLGNGVRVSVKGGGKAQSYNGNKPIKVNILPTPLKPKRPKRESVESGGDEYDAPTPVPDEVEQGVRDWQSSHEDPPTPPVKPDSKTKGLWGRGVTPTRTVKLGWIPIQAWTKIRNSNTVEHLPQEAAYLDAETLEDIINAPRLREVIAHKKVLEDYEEQGYEDSGYDHGKYNKHGEKYEDYEKMAHKNKGSHKDLRKPHKDNEEGENIQEERAIKPKTGGSWNSQRMVSDQKKIRLTDGQDDAIVMEESPPRTEGSEGSYILVDGKRVPLYRNSHKSKPPKRAQVVYIPREEGHPEQEEEEPEEDVSMMIKRSTVHRFHRPPSPFTFEGDPAKATHVSFPGKQTKRHYPFKMTPPEPTEYTWPSSYQYKKPNRQTAQEVNSVPIPVVSLAQAYAEPSALAAQDYYDTYAYPATYAYFPHLVGVPIPEYKPSKRRNKKKHKKKRSKKHKRQKSAPSQTETQHLPGIEPRNKNKTLDPVSQIYQYIKKRSHPDNQSEGSERVEMVHSLGRLKRESFESPDQEYEQGESAQDSQEENGGNSEQHPESNEEFPDYQENTVEATPTDDDYKLYEQTEPNARHPSIPVDSPDHPFDLIPTQEEGRALSDTAVNTTNDVPNTTGPDSTGPVKYVEQLTLAHFSSPVNLYHYKPVPKTKLQRLNDLAKILNEPDNQANRDQENLEKGREKRMIVDVDTSKYPYYDLPEEATLSKHSAIKYATNPDLIPKKTEGGMEFYEFKDKQLKCPDPEPPKDILPERNEDGENPNPVPDNLPRMKTLGDNIACMKAKYFGEDPFDNPFFKEGDEILSDGKDSEGSASFEIESEPASVSAEREQEEEDKEDTPPENPDPPEASRRVDYSSLKNPFYYAAPSRPAQNVEIHPQPLKNTGITRRKAIYYGTITPTKGTFTRGFQHSGSEPQKALYYGTINPPQPSTMSQYEFYRSGINPQKAKFYGTVNPQQGIEERVHRRKKLKIKHKVGLRPYRRPLRRPIHVHNYYYGNPYRPYFGYGGYVGGHYYVGSSGWGRRSGTLKKRMVDNVASETKPIRSYHAFIRNTRSIPNKIWMEDVDKRRLEPRYRVRRSAKYDKVLRKEHRQYPDSFEMRWEPSINVHNVHLPSNHKLDAISTTIGPPISISEFKRKLNISAPSYKVQNQFIDGYPYVRPLTPVEYASGSFPYTTEQYYLPTSTPLSSSTLSAPSANDTEDKKPTHANTEEVSGQSSESAQSDSKSTSESAESQSGSTSNESQKSVSESIENTTPPYYDSKRKLQVKFPNAAFMKRRMPLSKSTKQSSDILASTTPLTTTTSTTQRTTTHRMYPPRNPSRGKKKHYDAFAVLREHQATTTTTTEPPITQEPSVRREKNYRRGGKPRKPLERVEKRIVTKQETYKTSYVPEEEVQQTKVLGAVKGQAGYYQLSKANDTESTTLAPFKYSPSNLSWDIPHTQSFPESDVTQKTHPPAHYEENQSEPTKDDQVDTLYSYPAVPPIGVGKNIGKDYTSDYDYSRDPLFERGHSEELATTTRAPFLRGKRKRKHQRDLSRHEAYIVNLMSKLPPAGIGEVYDEGRSTESREIRPAVVPPPPTPTQPITVRPRRRRTRPTSTTTPPPPVYSSEEGSPSSSSEENQSASESREGPPPTTPHPPNRREYGVQKTPTKWILEPDKRKYFYVND